MMNRDLDPYGIDARRLVWEAWLRTPEGTALNARLEAIIDGFLKRRLLAAGACLALFAALGFVAIKTIIAIAVA